MPESQVPKMRMLNSSVLLNMCKMGLSSDGLWKDCETISK